jgi:RNA polymerase sigma-70 factor (ECF subfamily)
MFWDDRLLVLARAGHEASFAALVERHQTDVLETARGVLGDQAEAMDVAQEAFLALHRSLPAWEGRVAVGAWLHGVARNKALERRRRLNTRRRVESESARMKRVDGARSREPEADRCGGTRLREAIKQLSGRQRRVICSRFLQGASLAQTAALLGLSVNNVKVTVNRGLRALRKLLAHQ